MSRDAALFPSMFPQCEKPFGHDARIVWQDAATLFNSPICRFQFPLNQDTGECDLVLSQLCPAGWHVQNQEPIALQNSEPEPEIAMVRGRLEDYADRHPMHHEVGLVVEVAAITLVTDRYKAELYALAGIPVYWLINLVDGCIELMTQPQVVADQSG